MYKLIFVPSGRRAQSTMLSYIRVSVTQVFFIFLFLDVEIQGYLHSLSPIKNTKKKQTPYFDFFLQTSDTNKVRGICYEPQQRKNLLQPFQKKSPVKITGTKRISTTSFSTTNEEFKITKKNLKSCQLLQNSPIIHMFPHLW